MDLTSATLSWKRPKNDGGSPITGYVIERKDSHKTQWTRLEHVDADTFKLKATNLIDGQEYRFRVIAENKVGPSEPLETEHYVKPQSPFSKSSSLLVLFWRFIYICAAKSQYIKPRSEFLQRLILFFVPVFLC